MSTVSHLGIDPAKIVGYLLNLDHPEDGSKATRLSIVGPIWYPGDSTPDTLTIWQSALDSDTVVIQGVQTCVGARLDDLDGV